MSGAAEQSEARFPPPDSLLGRLMRQHAEIDPAFARWAQMSGYGHTLTEDTKAWAKNAGILDEESTI